jgi:hypothetical protein
VSKASERWTAVAVMLVVLLLVAALVAGMVAARGLLVGQPIDVQTALLIGVLYVIALMFCVAAHLIFDRYGDSQPEGELPEPKEGISRWTRR